MLDCTTGKECEGSGDSCGSSFTYPYFVVFNFLCTFLMLNLFVAVIMDNFDYLTRDSSILGPHHLDEFIRVWAEYDPGAKGLIHHKDMYEMLRNMEPPVGFGKNCPYRLAYRKLVRMNMPVDENGCVHFTTTLFALIRESLGIKTGPTEAMDQRDNELRATICKMWPVRGRKMLHILIPPDSATYRILQFQFGKKKNETPKTPVGDTGNIPTENSVNGPETRQLRQELKTGAPHLKVGRQNSSLQPKGNQDQPCSGHTSTGLLWKGGHQLDGIQRKKQRVQRITETSPETDESYQQYEHSFEADEIGQVGAGGPKPAANYDGVTRYPVNFDPRNNRGKQVDRYKADPSVPLGDRDFDYLEHPEGSEISYERDGSPTRLPVWNLSSSLNGGLNRDMDCSSYSLRHLDQLDPSASERKTTQPPVRRGLTFDSTHYTFPDLSEARSPRRNQSPVKKFPPRNYSLPQGSNRLGWDEDNAVFRYPRFMHFKDGDDLTDFNEPCDPRWTYEDTGIHRRLPPICETYMRTQLGGMSSHFYSVPPPSEPVSTDLPLSFIAPQTDYLREASTGWSPQFTPIPPPTDKPTDFMADPNYDNLSNIGEGSLFHLPQYSLLQADSGQQQIVSQTDLEEQGPYWRDSAYDGFGAYVPPSPHIAILHVNKPVTPTKREHVSSWPVVDDSPTQSSYEHNVRDGNMRRSAQ
ncbi:hypothetical protein P879_01462 [Paragonimus westermani]|uniref:Voltage-dependent calcium channel type A subunit alpha-1 n=1 Tax=Paragonimus westermani TaxID=34504 RepID=A0A8T0DKH5_9TREM|nr:hypothetical protein P879_01462 [Paragonimus westermani]